MTVELFQAIGLYIVTPICVMIVLVAVYYFDREK